MATQRLVKDLLNALIDASIKRWDAQVAATSGGHERFEIPAWKFEKIAFMSRHELDLLKEVLKVQDDEDALTYLTTKSDVQYLLAPASPYPADELYIPPAKGEQASDVFLRQTPKEIVLGSRDADEDEG